MVYSKLRNLISLKPNAHEKILIAVGIPIIAVADEKYTRETSDIPTVNMWWAHTKYPTNPIDQIANAIPGWEMDLASDSSRTFSDMKPNAGKIIT